MLIKLTIGIGIVYIFNLLINLHNYRKIKHHHKLYNKYRSLTLKKLPDTFVAETISLFKKAGITDNIEQINFRKIDKFSEFPNNSFDLYYQKCFKLAVSEYAFRFTAAVNPFSLFESITTSNNNANKTTKNSKNTSFILSFLQSAIFFLAGLYSSEIKSLLDELFKLINSKL